MHEFIHQNRFLLAFVMLSSFMGISVGMARVTTSLYALALHSSDTMLGLIAGSQSIGILIMSLPIGVLVDHFGPSRLFLVGTLLAGLTYLLIPLSPTPEFLLVCSMLISFFMPLRFVSLNTVFMEQLSKLGEGKAGWFRGTHMVGFFLLGPLLAPIVIAEVGFSGTFCLVAAAFGLTLLASPFVFSHYTEHRGHGRRFLWADVIGQLGLLRSDLALREVCLIEFFAQAINGFYAFFIIVIAIQSFHLGADDAARLAAAQGLSLIFALFFLGRLAQRFGQRTVYLGSFAWIAAALALLGVTPATQGLWAGGLSLGLGVGILEIVNAILLFLTAWCLFAGWLPWTRGKVKPSVALAALLASTVWIGPPLVQILRVQSSVGHWFDAILGLIREI